jgi:hypothetical protein
MDSPCWHKHLVWPENVCTGVLSVVAKNLAKTLDKGKNVEYRARVLNANAARQLV